MNAQRLMLSCMALLLCVALPKPAALAQTETTSNKLTGSNAIYAELLGQGLGITVNYERLLLNTTPINLSIRAGVGVFSFGVSGGVSAPLTTSLLVGRKHKVEIGVGVVAVTGGDYLGGSFGGVVATGLIGYRNQRLDGGFFRIGFTPVFGDSFLPFIGLSIGKAF